MQEASAFRIGDLPTKMMFRSEEPALFAERLKVVADLTRALDQVTRSGQEHVMNKVLLILRREILRTGIPIDEPDLAAVAEAMAELEHEAGRIAPTPGVFSRHAYVVIDALRRAGKA